MWFLLSNVVCNGIPCYLKSGSGTGAYEDGHSVEDTELSVVRVYICVSVWAHIQPLAHIIHASPRQITVKATVDAWAFYFF